MVFSCFAVYVLANNTRVVPYFYRPSCTTQPPFARRRLWAVVFCSTALNRRLRATGGWVVKRPLRLSNLRILWKPLFNFHFQFVLQLHSLNLTVQFIYLAVLIPVPTASSQPSDLPWRIPGPQSAMPIWTSPASRLPSEQDVSGHPLDGSPSQWCAPWGKWSMKLYQLLARTEQHRNNVRSKLWLWHRKDN